MPITARSWASRHPATRTVNGFYNQIVELPQERFAFFVENARTRAVKQFRFSLLIAVLIGVLLWQTQWLSLRPGLLILLAGQVLLAGAFLYRTSALKKVSAPSRDEMLRWVMTEQKFVIFSALGESLMRIIGFAVLAYGFWTATHILWISLLLGVLYPVISYFGIARRNTRQLLKHLEQQKDEIQ